MPSRLCRIAALLPPLLFAEKGEPDISGMLGGMMNGGGAGMGFGGGGSKLDVKGMENALKTGGAGALNDMLSSISAMSALHSGDKESLHIKKDENGNDMYDFTNPTTTPAPAPPPVPPPPPMKPKPVVKAVATPPADAKKVAPTAPPQQQQPQPVQMNVQPQQPQQMQMPMQQPQQSQQMQMPMQQPMQMQQPQMMGMPQQQFFQPQMQQMPQMPQMMQQMMMPPQQFSLAAADLTGSQRTQLQKNLLGMKRLLDAMEGSLGMGPEEVDEDQVNADVAKAQRRLDRRMKAMEKNNVMLQKELHKEEVKVKSVQAVADKEEEALQQITKENNLLRKSTSLITEDLEARPKQPVIKEYFHHKTPATPAPDSD